MFCFVQVDDDGLPRYLCEKCVTTVTQFYNFTVVYEQNVAQLRELLQIKDDGQDLDGSSETNEEERGEENVKGERDESVVVKEEIIQEDELEGELNTGGKVNKILSGAVVFTCCCWGKIITLGGSTLPPLPPSTCHLFLL